MSTIKLLETKSKILIELLVDLVDKHGKRFEEGANLMTRALKNNNIIFGVKMVANNTGVILDPAPLFGGFK